MIRVFATLVTVSFLAACGAADAAQSGETDTAVVSATVDQSLPTILVYKTATCGCCRGWVDHLREAGFNVDARDLPGGNPELMRMKVDVGVPGRMATCHTALVDGYVIEGHVPADQVKQLLAERPEVEGIGVPGMPIGSPGMEGPRAQPYQVVSWDRDGGLAVYAEIDPR